MSQPLDYKELLKKFILAAGGASGQCQVLYVVSGLQRDYEEDFSFSDEEKEELLRLKEVAIAEYYHD